MLKVGDMVKILSSEPVEYIPVGTICDVTDINEITREDEHGDFIREKIYECSPIKGVRA